MVAVAVVQLAFELKLLKPCLHYLAVLEVLVLEFQAFVVSEDEKALCCFVFLGGLAWVPRAFVVWPFVV